MATIKFFSLKNRKRRELGFTLIELVVVVAVVAILAGIITLSLSGAYRRARDSKRVQDIQAIADALEIYYSEFGVYPAAATMVADLSGTYMKEYPQPPLATDSYTYSNDCDNGSGFITTTAQYALWANLESGDYANNSCDCANLAGDNYCLCGGTCIDLSP